MNRNTNLHFANVPNIDIKRSAFDMSHSIKSTLNVGDIVPLFVDGDILPGDTVEMDMASIVRMATPIYPIMDNMFMDYYWFFVPNRLLWDNWAKFWGENDNPWTQTTEYEIPQIKPPSGGWTEGTIADYMGLPTKKAGNISVSALPMRAYAKIYNDWFRSENTNSCAHMYTDETTRTGSNGTNYITDIELGGKPAKAAKFHDYFTSALPSPQKGQAVTIPLGTAAPINGSGGVTSTLTGAKASIPSKTWNVVAGINEHTTVSNDPLKFRTTDNTINLTNGTGYNLNMRADGSTNGIMRVNKSSPTTAGDNNSGIFPSNLIAKQQTYEANVTGTVNSVLNLSGLTADLSAATAATVNQLRTAFAIQKYFENAGLHGTRYIEYIKGVFGVTSSDARFQRAEYLGGKRVPINVDQIIQTSSTDSTSPQGNTSGFSCTIDKHSAFTKSFEEHGVLMCLGVIRQEHSYQQGIDRMWSRKKWLDFYNPFFAHLGEQPILEKELYAQGTSQDEEVFGYQEAWAEYRYKPNKVTGYMRSNATGSLDVWHLADNYNSKPTLSPGWLEEPKTNVDRVIAVTSQITHQFIGDWYFKCKYVRPMPVYSVPGLIDHV